MRAASVTEPRRSTAPAQACGEAARDPSGYEAADVGGPPFGQCRLEVPKQHPPEGEGLAPCLRKAGRTAMRSGRRCRRALGRHSSLRGSDGKTRLIVVDEASLVRGPTSGDVMSDVYATPLVCDPKSSVARRYADALQRRPVPYQRLLDLPIRPIR